MDFVPWIVITVGLGIALAAGWHHADRRQQFAFTPGNSTAPDKRAVDAGPNRSSAPARNATSDAYEGLPNTYVLVGPPTVVGMGGPMLLRDWLVHGHPERNNVWADVVSEFYERAAADPEVASYFAGVDTSPLQKHSLTTLMMITGHGMTVGAVKQMQARHAEVRNVRGEPITPQVYGAAIGVLDDILTAKGVPPATRRHVQRVLAPVREAIVVREDEECEA